MDPNLRFQGEMDTVNWLELRKRVLAGPGKRILSSRIEVPVLPYSVTEFSRRADEPDSTPRELASILDGDTGLTFELLKHVNSSAFGMRHKVPSVVQAISALGIRRCKLFLLTTALQRALNSMQCKLLKLSEFCEGNLERGLFAREVSKLLPAADEDFSFTGGMLQDLLLPALINAYPNDYRKFVQSVSGDHKNLADFEREQFGWDHAEAGGELLLKWGFPDELVCAVALHHRGSEAEFVEKLADTSVAAVAISGLLPDALGQVPDGGESLIRMEQLWPEFHLLDLAETVSELSDSSTTSQGDRMSLVDRLERLVVGHLDRSVKESVVRAKQVGKYTLESKIGEGAMGVVYLAKHAMLSRMTAIKLLHTDTTNSEANDLFEREVQLTSQLSHPNTIAIYDYGRTPEGVFYYAMEYIDGITLHELVSQDGPQPESRVIHLLRQVCGSLAEAHAHGVIHRDIKPENIVLCNRGGLFDVVKVLDFGLVKFLNASREADSNRESQLAGTPLYMSPEAIQLPDQVDHRSDLYAVGAVAYYLLTGETVFTGKSAVEICMHHVCDRPESPSKRTGRQIAPDLQALVMKCLQKDRENRPNDAQVLADALANCEHSGQWTRDESQAWWSRFDTKRLDEKSNSAPASVDCYARTMVTTNLKGRQ